MSDKKQIIEKLKELIFQNLNIPVEYINDDMNLLENSDFDFDSIDQFELVSDVDAVFGTDTVHVDKQKLKTVDMVADEIIRQLKNK